MDEITENDFKNIYQGSGFYIGCIGGTERKSYYLITVSEGVVSRGIGIKLTLGEVEEIISSKGNLEVVARIKAASFGYIEIAPAQENTKLR